MSSSHPEAGNLFAALPQAVETAERFDTLFARSGVRIERIVSTGHASPEGFWYEQPGEEWVALLQGEALLRFEDEPTVRALAVGDWVTIHARRRHRVEATSVNPPAVWLAVHFDR